MQLKSLVTLSVVLSSLSFSGLVSAAPQQTTGTTATSAATGAILTGVATTDATTTAPTSTATNSSSLTTTADTTTTTSSDTGNSTSSGNSSSSGNSTSSSNSTSSGSHFVIYSDSWVTGGAPEASQIEGYNAFLLSFLLSDKSSDQAQNWETLDDATRKKVKEAYSQAGIKLMVSAFGGTSTPTTSGDDAKAVAEKMADWVIKYDLDGIDVDYEDTTAMNAKDGKAEEWVITFTKALREKLPQGKYTLTHAPMAPWFSDKTYTSGAYMKIHKEVGSMIDWYNIQFYNQGDYEDCDSLINKSKGTPGTSLLEIAAAGVDMNKLVVGKPADTKAASNGYIAPADLSKCLAQAKEKGWSAGAMVWEYPSANSKWIKDARGSVF